MRKRKACWSETGSASGRRSAGGCSSTSCWSCFSPAKVQVADRVAEALAARFEFGLRPFHQSLFHRLEKRFIQKNQLHLLRIVRPVGGEMHDAARRELFRRQRDERRLHQAALVVAFLRPWVGEEDVQRGERAGRNHVAQNL